MDDWGDIIRDKVTAQFKRELSAKEVRSLVVVVNTSLVVFSPTEATLTIINLRKPEESRTSTVKLRDSFSRDVHTIAVSSKQTHLALICNSGVSVIKDFILVPKSQQFVGEWVGHMLTSASVREARWHPLSNQHIGILTSNNVLSLINIDEPQEAELQLQLSNSALRIGVGMNRLEQCAMSFSFGGNGGNDWDLLTAYVLLNNGQVYSYCPILPSRTPIALEKLKEMEETATPTQQRWLSVMTKEIKGSFALCSPPVGDDFRIPAKQGPCEVIPEAVDISGEEQLMGCRLLTIPSTPSIVVLAHESGHIHILGALSASPLWEGDKASKPQLVVLEIVDLVFPKPCGVMHLTADPLHEDTFYVHHVYGAHRIQMPWLARIKAYLAQPSAVLPDFSGNVSSVDRLFFSGRLDDEQEGTSLAAPLGVAITADAILGYSLIALMNDGMLASVPLFHAKPFLPPKIDFKKGPGIDLGLDTDFYKTVEDMFSKDSTIPLMMSSADKSKELDPLVAYERIVKIKDAMHENVFLSLSKAKERIDVEVRAAQGVQQIQAKQLAEIKSRLAATLSKRAEFKSSVQATQASLEDVLARVRRVVLMLEEQCGGESDAEKELATQMDQMDKLVNSFLRIAVDNLGRKADELVELERRSSVAPPPRDALSDGETSIFKQLLTQQNQTISDLEDDIERVQRDIQMLRM